MAEIWTMGETLVEIMRTEVDKPLNETGLFSGPYPSGSSAIMISTVARMGHSCGIISGVGKDGFGECMLNRLKKRRRGCIQGSCGPGRIYGLRLCGVRQRG